jgi:hypothetical protein
MNVRGRKPYDGFDAIICLTLEEATERHDHMRAFSRELDIQMEFFRVRRHEKGGRYGCFESHVNICKMCLERGLDNALIFEDDVVPSRGYDPEVIKRVARFCRQDQTWNVVQLGYLIMQGQYDVLAPLRFLFAKSLTQDLIEYRGLQSHANCLSRRAMAVIVEKGQQLLASTEAAQGNIPHYDFFLKDLFSSRGQYCVAPMQFAHLWCQPSYNEPASLIEKMGRPLLCSLEKQELAYKFSLIRVHQKEFVVGLCIAVISVAAIVIALTLR